MSLYAVVAVTVTEYHIEADTAKSALSFAKTQQGNSDCQMVTESQIVWYDPVLVVEVGGYE